MKRALILLASAGFATASLAADLSGPAGGSYKDGPYYQPLWTGFYVGINGGYAAGNWNGDLLYNGVNAGYNPDKRTIDATGGFGGGQIGYNKQINSFVLGLEADIEAANFSGKGDFTTTAYAPWYWSKAHDLQLDDFGTLRGRIGYTVGSFLPYVTGGLAWGHTQGSIATTMTWPGGSYVSGRGSVAEDHVGYAVGAGVEAPIGHGLSVKVEYLFLDLGTEPYLFKGSILDSTGKPVGTYNTDSFRADLGMNTVKVGLNYHIGDVFEPLK